MAEIQNTLPATLAGYAKTKADTLCLVDKDTEYTYSSFWKRVNAMALFLKKEGVKAGDCVVCECTQNVQFVVADFAVELAGAIFVSIEYKASQSRFDDICAETEPVLFLYRGEYETNIKKIPLTETVDSLTLTDEELPLPDADTVTEILYTTGTTGKSKGIVMSHAGNFAVAENIKYGTEMKPGNVELIPLPLSHSHAIRCTYANLLNGGTVILADGVMRVKLLFDFIEQYGVTAMDISPSAALILIKLSKGSLANYNDQLDYIQLGTAVLPEETKQMLLEMLPGTRLYNFYGSTESGRSCTLDFSKINKPNCIGKPTKNAEFIVVDDNRNPIESSVDNQGLLASRGKMNMVCYWKAEKLTAETMQNGFVYSNDLGYIDEDGLVYVLGRRDDIINYKGIKISPEEIEETVRRHPSIKDCACVPKKDELSGQIPVLFISLNNADTFDRKELVKYIEENIDKNKHPKEIRVIDEIPRTYNGKLSRKELVKQL